ncbi:MAG TPA: hypothetical protein PKY30_03140 [Myxococcota bacterium]|nr:hypothetical protein [Myxococcota bacterium]HNH46003.1 hypothetical protein [Myxococcota bacterium]
MFLWVALAAAADSSPATYLPGAAAMEKGSVQVGGGLGMYSYAFTGGGDGALIPYVAAEVAPADRLVLYGSLMAFADLENVPVFTPTRPTAVVALRYNAVEKSSFSLAPWVGLQVGTPVLGDRSGRSFDLAAGLAMEGGSERIRWDLSVPLFWYDGSQGLYGCGEGSGAELLCLTGTTEAGATFRLAPEWSLRVGKGPATALAVGFRVDKPRWYLETTLMGPVLLGGAFRTEAGLRF